MPFNLTEPSCLSLSIGSGFLWLYVSPASQERIPLGSSKQITKMIQGVSESRRRGRWEETSNPGMLQDNSGPGSMPKGLVKGSR